MGVGVGVGVGVTVGYWSTGKSGPQKGKFIAEHTCPSQDYVIIFPPCV